MANKKTLADLEDDRFSVEPKGWSLNSRDSMVHLFFNILGEKCRVPKDKLPSINAKALEKMTSPIAVKLVQFRSLSRTLGSLEGVQKFIHPDKSFLVGHPGNIAAVVQFNSIGFDNVERIFALSKLSVPLNVDKRVRNAFTVGDRYVKSIEVELENKILFEQLEEN